MVTEAHSQGMFSTSNRAIFFYNLKVHSFSPSHLNSLPEVLKNASSVRACSSQSENNRLFFFISAIVLLYLGAKATFTQLGIKTDFIHGPYFLRDQM